MGVPNKSNRQSSAKDRPKSEKAKFLTKILLDLILSRNYVVSSTLASETNKSYQYLKDCLFYRLSISPALIDDVMSLTK